MGSSSVSNMIDRYVKRFQQEIPFRYRGKAGRELHAQIDDRLHEKCADRMPLKQDVREVLAELGPAKKLGQSRRGSYEFRKYRSRKTAVKILRTVEFAAMMTALILVTAGTLFLAFGRTYSLRPVIIGAIMALAVTIVRALSAQSSRGAVFDSEENRRRALETSLPYEMAVSLEDDYLMPIRIEKPVA